ncbi:TIGR03545 family protein [Treponema bryantii]|uniref:TIGR03545 family protein n=1 Tax=Treponema bryantii TaxID=163 RepID=A0A1H9DLH5_9SPIR|nr:TIGR03545 family protein [Treponema bryantii]SEQ14167.1 TIGR03545 family protein [Treponema bryantii]
MKKIPSLFRKKYTAKKLEKKIYKRLYVPEDKKYVKGLFTEIEKKGAKQIPIFAIPPEKAEQLAKKDMKRLKALAKQIKKQKGRVNFVPLIVTAAFIVAIPICFITFKNIIVKKGIIYACETIFEAKCDIQNVDFKLLDSSLKIKKLEIANKDDYMKNLVDIGSITVDFDLGQLLRKRFVADELSVLGVDTGTERKTSGELPPKKEKKIKKQKEKAAKEASESKLGQVIAEKKAVAANSLESNITGLFNQLNPETLMNNFYSQLQTPELSKQVQEQIPQIVAKWQAKPAEVQQTVDELQKSVNDIMNFDYSAVQNNPLKIKEFIEKIDSTKKNIEKVKNDANGVMKNFNADLAEADGLRKSVQNAVTHDMNFANSEINKIKSLNISDGTKLISGMFENVACDVLGKYYPYAMKGVDYILDLKTKQGSKPKEAKVKKEKKKYSVKRAPGRDIFYRQDKVPALWIKKMAGSGPNFFAQATDIASNQDIINKPAKIDFNMELYNLQHEAKLVVDFRTDTKEPLIRADYGLKNIPLNIPAEKFGEYPGVPSFDAKCAVDAILKIFDKDGFELSGKGLLTDLKIATVPFEPEYASKIYSNVMGRINTVRAGITSGFTLTDGLKMNLDSDADVQVINSLKKEMEAQLAEIKDNLKTELTKKINEASGGALGQFDSLDDIKTKLTGSLSTATGFEKQLNQKRTEAEKQLKGKATDEAKKQLGNQLKNLF